MTGKKFTSLILLLFGVSLILLLIQSGVIYSLRSYFIFFYSVWSIYLFHFLITAGIFTLLYFVGKSFPKYIGFTFMGLILFKMAAAIIFLLPLIKMKEVSKIPDFISFFAPYFFYLIIEIILTMRLLKLFEDELFKKEKIQKNNND